MKDGYIKVAAGVPTCTVADVRANTESVKELIDRADKERVNLLVLPELCLTGYTCGDLFFSDTLLTAAQNALLEVTDYTEGKYPVTVVGVPLMYRSKLYNCAAVLCDGAILGIVPKTHLPNHAEFYEKRQFTSAADLEENACFYVGDQPVAFGTDLVFCHEEMREYAFGIEICEDLWAPNQPAEALVQSGATIIVNPSASNETVGKAEYREGLVRYSSARLLCGYVYASASIGESTQDTVFGGHCLIAENGAILAENKPFAGETLLISEIDVKKLASERLKNTSFVDDYSAISVMFEQSVQQTKLTRRFTKTPFVPSEQADLLERCETILNIQSYGLCKRLRHTGAKKAVLGISGGLDSTLALLVAVRAMKLLGRPVSDVLAVTMPGFGTTGRTRTNAEVLCERLGVSFREVNITAAVRQHFADIGQDENNHDVTYENAQARERTQVLMDIANQLGGLVIGTGDLSELALGWATYNGDHMSMYGVNASVPKTLVRVLVRREAETLGGDLQTVLEDILDTPVSPELLPSDDNGDIAQKTEDLVGPYELHDFFLYHLLRYGEGPKKIYRLAKMTFAGEYDGATILHWLEVFIKRFLSQQYKRSCLPDGPKIGSVSLSPRGDWRQPSDASAAVWLEELRQIETV